MRLPWESEVKMTFWHARTIHLPGEEHRAFREAVFAEQRDRVNREMQAPEGMGRGKWVWKRAIGEPIGEWVWVRSL